MPMMSTQPYNVPVISTDLRRDETIHQIVDSLDFLDKIANEVFTRIHSRVTENQSKLQKINERVNLTQMKIDKIKGTKKATKVCAASKYPAPDSKEMYKTLFEAKEELRHPKRPSYHVQAKHKGVDDTVLKEKCQYYSVKSSKKKKTDATKEGLGGLPKTIPSISSLILFNTSENPYKKYVMFDPLGAVTKTRTALEEEEAVMADAPDTIKTNEELKRQQMENYFYVPGIGQVPELDVPIALPNLLGVADDITYNEDLKDSIAPSVMNIPDLPSVVPEAEAIPDGPATGGAAPAPPPPAGAPPAPPPPPPPASAPPPPPPPPPPSQGAPPPPPPPPPDAGGAPAPPPPPPPSGDIPQEVVSGDGGRSSLMDAIRKAGGAGKAKLKSAQKQKEERREKKKEEKSSKGGGGGDLMGDLFAKLTMRRKGISGSGNPGSSEKGESSGGGGSAMDKISSMIPAPPKPEGGGEEPSQADDDWDD